MKTFTQKKKDALLAEIIRHQEADQIIQGIYGNDKNGKAWKGCAVGCSIHSLNQLEGKKFQLGDHHVYETELGIPEPLAYLEDRLFEGMPKEQALSWPARFISAVPVDTDLSLVLPAFYIRILTDKEHGVRQWAFDDGKKAIDQVVEVHKSHIAIGTRDEEAARSAAESAYSAAESAYSAAAAAVYSAAYSVVDSAAYSAYSAAYSAARSAVYSAASAAESAAYSAAYSVVDSAESAAYSVYSAARSAQYVWMSDVLIECLENSQMTNLTTKV